MSLIGKAVYGYVAKRRQQIYNSNRKRLKNETPTIIANNCFGTLVYHDLGLRFLSPMINLFMQKDEYLIFLSNMKEYLDCEMTEVTDSGRSYPVGELVYQGKSVRIFGMHYKSLSELKEKWDERKTRMDYENIFIVLTALAFTEADAEVFDSLEYENKLVITGTSEVKRPYVVRKGVLRKKNYDIGRFVQYNGRFSVKKPMDCVDYVKFLNKGK